jgi:outer membrane protein TolC
MYRPIAILVAFWTFVFVLNDCTANAQTSISSSDSLRLGKVIKDVIARSDRIKAARFMERAVAAEAKGAGAWDDPMVMIGFKNLPTSLDFNEDGMTMKMLGLSQTIPYAGEKGLRKRVAEANRKSSISEREDTELEVITSAKLAFYDIYYNTKALSLYDRQTQIAAQIVASVRSKLETGQANPEDYAAAQADLWRQQSLLAPYAHAIETAQLNLNDLRGAPADSFLPYPATPQFALLPETHEPWLEAALLHYPPLKQLAAKSNSSSYSAAASQRMRWPMLTISGDYGFRKDTPSEKRSDMIGLQANISLPIFSARKNIGMRDSQELMKFNYDAQADQLKRDVEARLRALFLDALHERENIQLYRDRIIPADEEAYQHAFSGYINNRTSLTTLMNYSITTHRDRLTLNQLEYDFARTIAMAERYTTDPATLSGK